MIVFEVVDCFFEPAEVLFLKRLVAQRGGSFTTLEIIEFFQSLVVDKLVDELTSGAAKTRFLLCGFERSAAVNTFRVHVAQIG